MMLELFGISMTVVLYWAAKKLYQHKPKVYFSPLILSPLLIVGFLLWTGIPYETYNVSASWLTDLLQPATIAFAIPLYKSFATLKKHASEIIASVLCGSVVAIATSALLAQLFDLNLRMVDSLIPRSVTTPIAMNISEMVGGIPAVTAVFVIITGIFGSQVGPAIIRLLRIENEVARGVMLGTNAHGAGTSKAFEFSAITGTVSSLSMILAAFITLGVAPWFLPVLMMP
ncbi:CidB/LrgB family autolysis modulator [Brevibacillus migulae]|uniref:CidB/LrgB family autolysis modulator n=1 Tax=Brevibacillus migulae TaxID=1644114 RepID=UPI00106E37B5|nr:CidB/LrgB family autolysis modulator [Brevibacillus migulae]